MRIGRHVLRHLASNSITIGRSGGRRGRWRRPSAAAGEVATAGAAQGASAGQLAAHGAGGRQQQGRGRRRRAGSQQQARWAGAAEATDNGGGYRVSVGPVGGLRQ